MLVGLAVIDFNLYLRGDYLEKLPDTIEWSKYLRIQYAPVPTSAPAAAPAAVSLAFATPAAVIAPTVSYAVAGGGSDANGEEHEHEQQLLHAVTEVAEEKDEATVTAEATAAAEGEPRLSKAAPSHRHGRRRTTAPRKPRQPRQPLPPQTLPSNRRSASSPPPSTRNRILRSSSARPR